LLDDFEHDLVQILISENELPRSKLRGI